MRNVYMTDGSVEGFFTAVFDAYLDKDGYIASMSGAFQTALGDRFIEVSPSREKSTRVVDKLREVDRLSLGEIDYALRTAAPDREQVAFLYIRLLMKRRAPVRGMLTSPEVRRLRDLCDRVASERHQLSGFLRFQETATGVYYAPCSPDNDLVDLLMPHFVARFKNTPFVIHDVSRAVAGIYNGDEWLVSPVQKAELVLSEAEENFLNLWKKYYHTVYIPARKNTKQMKGYMPVRYWKFMSEKVNEEIDFPEKI
jgi:probable DNA metabolism protein